MSDQDLREMYTMPGHLVRRVAQIHSALLIEECGAFDLTSVQFAALTAIQAHPGVDATRLSALIAFDRSTLGDVLERLETKGWVVRTPGESDRRVKAIRISRDGAELLRRVRPAIRRVQERLLAPLAPAERDEMVRLLGRIAEVHNEVLPAPLRAAE